MGDETSSRETFTTVDWDALTDARWRGWLPSPDTATALGALCCVGAGLAYDIWIVPPGTPTVPGWDVSRLDWLTLGTAAIAVGYGLVPAVKRPRRTRQILGEVPTHPLPMTALAGVLVMGGVGLVGPAILAPPTLDFSVARQPPAFTTVHTKFTTGCVGPVVGETCRGTLRTPLGTTRAGESVLVWMVYGTRTTLQFALISTTILAPIAAVTGTTAAYYGGWVEDGLLGLATLQSAVPTFLVYFLLVVFVNPSLFVLILVYGLFNWGGTAQVVYGEAVSESEAVYVRATEGAGASGVYTIRRHLLPNVSGTIVTEASLLIPKLILLEVLFSFVGLGGDQSFSWGQLVQRGLRFDPAQVGGGFTPSLRGVGIGQLGGLWWITFVPIIGVVLSVFLFSVVGDAVEEAIELQ